MKWRVTLSDILMCFRHNNINIMKQSYNTNTTLWPRNPMVVMKWLGCRFNQKSNFIIIIIWCCTWYIVRNMKEQMASYIWRLNSFLSQLLFSCPPWRRILGTRWLKINSDYESVIDEIVDFDFLLQHSVIISLGIKNLLWNIKRSILGL